MMKEKLLVLDANYICHRAAYSMKGLSYQEKSTGVIFGFLLTILDLAERFKANKLVYAFDSRGSHRKNLYPEYKNRKFTKTQELIELDKIARPQFFKIKKYVLPRLGFNNIFYHNGYEADDIIASIVKENKDFDIVVCSKDQDLYQLLNLCSMYKFDKNGLYTKENFTSEYGIDPAEWAAVKSMAGCSSDNVIGIDGVGEKTAIKYILGTLPAKSKAFKNIESEEGQKKIKDNFDLVKLPFFGTYSFPIEKDEFNFTELILICHEYGFKSIVESDKLNKFHKIFVGE
jgi:5'-3' exonuclease